MAQKSKSAEDLRVRRTRKLLTQALIELTIEKGFATITVQDLVDRAMINRATFYRHFVDKYDLLNQYMNGIYELTATQEKPNAEPSDHEESQNPTVGMIQMFEQVRQNAEFFRVMLGAKGDAVFAHRIHQYSEMRLRHLIAEGGGLPVEKTPPLDMCLSFLSHAGVGVIAWWLDDGQAHSPEQVAAWLAQLTTATLDHVL